MPLTDELEILGVNLNYLKHIKLVINTQKQTKNFSELNMDT